MASAAVSQLVVAQRYSTPPMVMPNATTEACSRLMLPVTNGRRAVRRISASMSRSTTSLMAAVPPLTNPIPMSACSSVHESDETPDLAAAK